MQLKTYIGYKFDRKIEKVTEEEIEQSLKDVQEEQIEWVKVDRPVIDGDLVDVDIKIKNCELAIGKDNGLILRAIEENLLGQKLNHTVIVSKKPDYFRVQINSIKESSLPAIDDNLAKKLGYENLEAMKAHGRKQLKEYRINQANIKLKDEIINRIIEDNPFEVNDKVFNKKYCENDIKSRKYLESQRMPPAIIEETMKKKNATILAMTTRECKKEIVLKQIALNEGIELSVEESHAGIKHLADKKFNGNMQEAVDYLLKNENIRKDMHDKGIEFKTIEWLLGKSEITDVEI